MMSLLRRLRGVAGTAVTWGIAWSAIAVFIRVVRHLFNPVERSWSDLAARSVLPALQYGFLYGVAMGAGFACLVLLMSVARARWKPSLCAHLERSVPSLRRAHICG